MFSSTSLDIMYSFQLKQLHYILSAFSHFIFKRSKLELLFCRQLVEAICIRRKGFFFWVLVMTNCKSSLLYTSVEKLNFRTATLLV